MNITISIVDRPVITADNVLHVVLNAGFKHPAYSDAKTPTVDIENAKVLSKIIFFGIILKLFKCDKFSFLGIVTLLLNCNIPDFEKPCNNNLGIERLILNDSTAFPKTFIKVGINTAPIIVANVVDNNIHLNVDNKLSGFPIFIVFSIVLANNGA